MTHLDGRRASTVCDDAMARARVCDGCRAVLVDLVTHIDALNRAGVRILQAGDGRKPENRQGATP